MPAKTLQRTIYIVSAKRTPFGTFGGKLKDQSAIDLGVVAAKAALERGKVAPDQVDHVIFGNALQTSSDALYGARHVGLKAGVPEKVPALTVNRICGSGLQSVVTAGQMLLLDEATCVVAGGFESMSQSPHVLRGLREGLRFGPGAELQDLLFDSLMDPFCGFFMAQTAENLAKEHAISREAQDEFAHRSHAEGAKAVKAGKFAAEIVPVKVKRGYTGQFLAPALAREAKRKKRVQAAE